MRAEKNCFFFAFCRAALLLLLENGRAKRSGFFFFFFRLEAHISTITQDCRTPEKAAPWRCPHAPP